MYDSGFIILDSLIYDPGDRLSYSSLMQGEDQERIIANTTSTMSSSTMTSMANALLNPTDSSVDVLLEIIYPKLCGTVTNIQRVKQLTRPRLTITSVTAMIIIVGISILIDIR